MNKVITGGKALLAAPEKPKTPTSQAIVEVARKYSVSPFRQMREMLSLNRGQGKLGFHEYYGSGCFDPDLTRQQKGEFVGENGSYKLNSKLSPFSITSTRAFIRDKVMYCALLEQLGFRTTKTQAVVLKGRSYGNIRALRTIEDIEKFLVEDAEYPLFGKPVEGSKSVGSVFIKDIDRETGVLLFENGVNFSVADISKEIFEDFEAGFIFQSAVEQHADMSKITGDAVGTLRVVTIRKESGVEVLYSLWKIPAPDAMSDNFWQTGSMIAEIDKETGKLVKCKRGSGLDAEWIEAHPVNGEVFAEHQVPHWEATKKIATDAHSLFTEFGVFGWDIAMTSDGPLIIECNANPFHSLYQLSTGRGVLNEEFMPHFDAVISESDLKVKAKKSEAKKLGL